MPPVLGGHGLQPIEPLARLPELRIVVPCLLVRTGLPRTDNHSPFWLIGWPEELFEIGDRTVPLGSTIDQGALSQYPPRWWCSDDLESSSPSTETGATPVSSFGPGRVFGHYAQRLLLD